MRNASAMKQQNTKNIAKRKKNKQTNKHTNIPVNSVLKTSVEL